MSEETPAEQIERLETLNHKLSMQIMGMSDRLNDSALQIAAKAWDEGWLARGNHDHHTNWPEEYREQVATNPYTQMIEDKDANQ